MASLRSAIAFQATSSKVSCRIRSQQRSLVVAAGLHDSQPPAAALPELSRRQLQAAVLAAVLASQPSAAHAVGFKKELKKRKIPVEDYSELAAEPRLKFYELEEGSGAEVKEGSRVVVHFTCIYRGLNVVSSRAARVLGGNRTVAEPFEFIAGQPVSGTKGRIVDNAGGLYAGGGGPTPPPALSTAVVGMKVGGKRSLLVPAELGYGTRGEQEIPPDCPSFELRVELLSVA